jgi:hypothetical protein
LIGHIKGYVTFDNGGAVGLSIVKKTVNLKPQGFNQDALVHSFKLALTNIVFTIGEDELGRLVELGLSLVLPLDFAKKES